MDRYILPYYRHNTFFKIKFKKIKVLILPITFAEPASSGHKPKRRAHLLRKKALSGGTFFDGSKKDPSTKGSYGADCNFSQFSNYV